ncbi:MAG: 4'-phosphopantetheinyl transferase superfamily protein [Bacteroidaceae bacterium]|nr:4'-phosphopantetheinyl transferase superfamily protein [Bacteroidaceae bacterium]
MALYKTIKCKEGALLGVWKIDETPEDLLSLYPDDQELQQLYVTKINAQRLLEKMAVRVLLHTLLPDPPVSIHYEPTGKPILNGGELNVSISHTKGFVAVIIAPFRHSVGVDIEPISDRVVKVAARFMGDKEYESLMHNSDKSVATICWSAKEALYKILGKPVVDFRNSMCLSSFPVADSGEISVEIFTETKQTFLLDYVIFDSIVLVWAEYVR